MTIPCPAVDLASFREFSPTSGIPGVLTDYLCADGAHVGVWTERAARYRIEGDKWICDSFAQCIQPAKLYRTYERIR